ncbi:MAG TPA: MFS transporter [Tepidisphaeraceae bacterium]|nr:MFS transporter [Tepidisphaeraceae bacterium]
MEATTTADRAGMVDRPSDASVKFRLSVMMFLQYAIWGAWLPLLWPFLIGHRGLTPDQVGWIFAVGAIGAILAPFIAGQIADRYFATEKFLGISHVLGGILVWQLASIETYWGFLAFSLLYSVIYSPTLSLTNSLSFHHLPDRDRDFGKVRVWGTVGWIVVGIGIGQWLLAYHTPLNALPQEQLQAQYAGMADAFRLSAILGILMGLYCFTLPHTPPSKEKKSNASLKALREVRRNPLLTLFLLAVPISCIHQFYFVHTAGFLGGFQSRTAESINRIFGVGGGGLMTIGQISEIAVLALIPLVAKDVSRKTLLAIGIAAYAVRMALFAYVEPIHTATGVPQIAILMLGVAMHGLCFGCFIFVAFMVVDEETTPDVRASAQSLFNLVIVGIGIIVGSKIATGMATWAAERPVEGGAAAINYTALFSVPMWAALGCLAILLIFYPRRRAATAKGLEHQPEVASVK